MRDIFLLALASIWLFDTRAADGFVENRGQWTGAFRYKAEILAGEVYLENNSILFHLIDKSQVHAHHIGEGDPAKPPVVRHHAFRLRFSGANPVPGLSTHHPYPHYNNYFLGNDPSRWKGEVPAFRQVTFHDIYDGVDLVVYVNGSGVKYEFALEAGVDPSVIRVAFEGVDGLETDRHGNLQIQTGIEDVLESKPIASQARGKKTYDIACEFAVKGTTVTYAFPNGHDPDLPLLIDPELIFSTYSGSTSNNFGYTATFDDDGHLYGGSTAFGTQYPTTVGAWDETFSGGQVDVAVTKFNLSGTNIVYSTYLGGSASEMPHSMITDESGRLYVMGTTGSDDFPTTNGAYDPSFNEGTPVSFLNGLGLSFNDGSDMYIAAFNPNGTALYGSTYLGGSGNDGLNTTNALRYNYADEARGEINIGKDGSIYVASCTRSDDFPEYNASFSTGFGAPQDGVVVRMNPQLTSLVWSGYLGGSSGDAIYSIDIAPDSSVYVAGGTASNDFPTVGGAFDDSYNQGRSDAFVSHISDDANLLHSTYFGTSSYDQAYFVRVDRKNRPHIFGQTEHGNSQLIYNAAYSDVGGGQFVCKFEEDLSAREWSTQFGSEDGRPNISPTAFLVDVCNSVYLSGWGGAVNTIGTNNNAASTIGLDVTNDAFQSTTDFSGSDFYLMVLSSDGNSLIYGSFYGGGSSAEHVDGGTSRFDRAGKIYQAVCASCGNNNDFPIKPDPGAFSETNGSNCNLGVFKMDFELPVIIADFDAPEFGCAPFTVNFDNESVTQQNTSFQWIFSNGQTSTQTNPSITFTNSGTFTATLVISDPTSCNLSDTLVQEIVIKKDTNYELPPIPACIGQKVTLGPDPNNYEEDVSVSWSPAGKLSNPNVLNPTVALRDTTMFTMIIDYGGCQEVATQEVQVDNFPVAINDDTIVCSTSDDLLLAGTSYGVASQYEWSTDSLFEELISTDSTALVGKWDKGLNYYYFRATKPNGCQKKDTVLVTVSDYDLELTADTFICLRDTYRILAYSRNPKNTFQYLWTDNAIVADTFNQPLLTVDDRRFLDVSPPADEDYHLLALSKAVDNCLVQDSVLIEVSSLDPLAVEADADKHSAYFFEPVRLHGEPPIEGSFSGIWEPDRDLDDATKNEPLAHMSRTTVFRWTVTDEEFPTCKFGDTTIVEVFEINCGEPDIFIPNAFTPNGDGENDKLFVRGRYLESIEFSVYNRWGEQVFATESLKEGWDGTHKDTPVEPAVYVYQLTAYCLDGARYYTKGNVTVIR